LNQHRAIFEGLRQRNPEQAREAMMEHLKFVQAKVPLIFKEKFS
jgi:DNA-binding FadR family transcriptional regulator